MKTLIMLSAIPASGKSTWAKRYTEEHPNTYILNSDEIRMEVTGGNYLDHSRQKEVWELFERRIHEFGAIPDSTVILDALNDVNEVIEAYNGSDSSWFNYCVEHQLTDKTVYHHNGSYSEWFEQPGGYVEYGNSGYYSWTLIYSEGIYDHY